MATIGTFTTTNSGFTAASRPSASRPVAITPIEKRGETAPDYRGVRRQGRDRRQAGPAPSKGGREFVSLKLDDPSFPAPIYANLIERDGQHELIWSR